jgi:hypothetical protein
LQSLGPFLGDLRWRFVAAVTFNLTAVVDRFGQIALLNRDGALVCMFFAFRRTLVAWMPDGTYFSPAERLGRPPTRDAQERIGAALRDAEAASARADA